MLILSPVTLAVNVFFYSLLAWQVHAADRLQFMLLYHSVDFLLDIIKSPFLFKYNYKIYKLNTLFLPVSLNNPEVPWWSKMLKVLIPSYCMYSIAFSSANTLSSSDCTNMIIKA